jgi:predicted transcriptional regulator
MSIPLGDAIKKKRKDLKLSVPLLSYIIGFPVTNIYKWEAGTRPLERDATNKLEKFVKGDYDTLAKKTIAEKKAGLLPTKKGVEQNIFRESVEIVQLKENLIESQKETIDTQKKLIENLQEQLKSFSEQGKAGARLTSE